jgi:hypothetical protein
MTSWNDFAAAAPELSTLVQARIQDTGLAMLATLRADGSPRISGIEPTIFDGEIWLGMMDRSLKARDLQRDPRLSLHNATVDKELTRGDVKISGRGVEITDDETKRAFLKTFIETNGYGPPEDSPLQLFTVDITEVASVQPGGDHLVIQSWSPERGLRRVERR